MSQRKGSVAAFVKNAVIFFSGALAAMAVMRVTSGRETSSALRADVALAAEHAAHTGPTSSAKTANTGPAAPCPSHSAAPSPYPSQRAADVSSASAATASAEFNMTALKVFLAGHIKKEFYNLGHADCEHIMPALTYSYEYSTNPDLNSGAVYDIGANLGETSARIMDVLVPGMGCARFQAQVTLTGPHDPCPYWVAPVYAFEPVPATFKVLQRRVELEGWAKMGYQAINAAMTDVIPPEKKIKFFGDASEGNQQGGLDPYGAASTNYTLVDVTSVDEFRRSHQQSDKRIFLLKVDVEGFDAQVVNGAQEAFKAKLVKWLVSEYNWKARKMNGQEGPWSLRKITQALFEWGYECHLMSPTQMIPLSGDFWQDSYEIWYWSNFICAQRCDADLLRLVRAYNKEVQVPRPDCPTSPSPI